MMQVGEYGDKIPMQTDLDLVTVDVTQLRIKVVRPDSSTVTHVLSSQDIVQPPSLGMVYYTIIQGDLTVDGLYSLQVTDATSGRNVMTAPVEVYVHPNI